MDKLPDLYTLYINFLIWGIPYLAYFLGIIIRKKVSPSEDSPKLSKQLWAGIPAAVGVVLAYNNLFEDALVSMKSYISLMYVIMQQGMFSHEKATKILFKNKG